MGTWLGGLKRGVKGAMGARYATREERDPLGFLGWAYRAIRYRPSSKWRACTLECGNGAGKPAIEIAPGGAAAPRLVIATAPSVEADG